MARHKEPRKRFASLAVLLGVVLALVLPMLGIAAPAQATGNQGTIKVHALGSEPGTESNEPKVCEFNLEFYNFVEGFDGYVEFDVQGGDGPTGVFAGPFAVGTANADGYFVSQYFNVDGGPTIQNGHYKVTLYGKFNDGRINYEDVKAKSKVFKVECLDTPPPPPPPTPKDCPEGSVLISTFKYNTETQTYVAEGNANGVTVTGNASSGSFTSTSSVSAFVLTGTANSVVVTYESSVKTGDFSNGDLPTVNGQSQNITSIKFCGSKEEPPPPPAPEGSNNSSTPGCEQITVGTPTGVKPEGATVVVKLDGVVTNPGTYPTTPGTHVVTTFVNGTLVDTDSVVVENCPVPPPPVPPTDACPEMPGTQPPGTVCTTPPPPPVPPTDVCPNMPGNQPVGTVCTPPVPPTPTPEPATKNKGSIYGSCVTPARGEGVAKGRVTNARSTRVTVKQNGQVVKTRVVAAGARFRMEMNNLQVGSVVKLFMGGKLVDRDMVENDCVLPPHVGLPKVAATQG